MDKKIFLSFLVLALAVILLSPGVSRAVSTEVYLTSEPSVAEVYLDGSKVGNTPCTVQVQGLERHHRLELKREGCRSNVTTLMNTSQDTGDWDPSVVAPAGYGEILEDATLHIVLKKK